MLFNSIPFLFLFLPTAIIGYYVISKFFHYSFCIYWLCFLSIFFYGYWNLKYLWLIVFSIIANYLISKLIVLKKKITFLVFGIFINLLIIIYFKYSNFFLENLNLLDKIKYDFEYIILPLGISFFTFQQIGFLIDVYFDNKSKFKFSKYFLFVSFFPQLIAGPIIRKHEIFFQLNNKKIFNFNYSNFAIAISIFTIGLFKKIFIADSLSVYANSVFFASENGIYLSFIESWVGAITYSLQLYFDFSGYSDMAIGLALMFNIKIPVNFLSPYKSNNISEFWRKWHITLSNFIRDYLYYPVASRLTRLSVNKELNIFNSLLISVAIPTLFAFFFVGLWHGAGWNFIIFGLIHGFGLIFYNYWLTFKTKLSFLFLIKNKKFLRFLSTSLTFLYITIAWVFFRSENLISAKNMIGSMFGFNGISLPNYLEGKVSFLEIFGFNTKGLFYNGIFQGPSLNILIWILVSFLIVFFAPNVKEIFNKNNYKIFGLNLTWKPDLIWSVFLISIFILSVFSIDGTVEFLYFQF
jgi:alginate O-acetyltransferase complex protein AlgI